MAVSGCVASVSTAQIVYDLNTWNGDIRIQGDDAHDRFGASVSSGDFNGDGIDDIIIGAYEADPVGRSRAGETYVVYGSFTFPANLVVDLNSVPADITIYGNDPYDHAGYSVSSGDINGDGIDDIIFGAHGSEPPGGGDGGEAYVIYGHRSFPPNHTVNLNSESADITIYGDDTFDLCGESVASGDINSDGIDDIIIGAGGSTPAPMTGKAYVIYGSPSFPANHIIDLNSVSADITVLGAKEGDRLGTSVSIGDINEDGTDDLLIGAPQMGVPLQTRGTGEAYVMYGRDSFPPNHIIDLESRSLDITLYGRSKGDNFGNSVSCGDINGDGIDDIIIGACQANPHGGEEAGETYVIYGTNSFPVNHKIDLTKVSADITVCGDDADDYSGYSVSNGDINGDGIDDILIGAYGADTESGDLVGECYVIYGSPSFPANYQIDLDLSPANIIVYGDNELDKSGWAVSSGDINGDGIGDIFIGARAANPVGGVAAGEAYVIYGTAEVSVEEHETPRPTHFALSQNYPNPFNLTTHMIYQIGNVRSPVYTTLEIYDVLGQRVKTLINEAQEAGYHTVKWDGTDCFGNPVSTGVYFYRLVSGEFVDTRSMILVK